MIVDSCMNVGALVKIYLNFHTIKIMLNVLRFIFVEDANKIRYTCKATPYNIYLGLPKLSFN